MRVWYKKERLFPHMHHLLVYAFIGFTGQKRNFYPNSIPILKELMFTTYLYLFFFHLYDLFFIYLTYFSFILGLFYYTNFMNYLQLYLIIGISVTNNYLHPLLRTLAITYLSFVFFDSENNNRKKSK
jgi:hypothetical protein